jgi:hypothetical protein
LKFAVSQIPEHHLEEELLIRLKGDKSWRELTRQMKIKSHSTLDRWINRGITNKGMEVIARHIRRSLESVEDYFAERINLDDLLDPTQKLPPTADVLNFEDIDRWIEQDARFQQKINLLEKIAVNIASGVLHEKDLTATDFFHWLVQSLIDSEEYSDRNELYQALGFTPLRIQALRSGEIEFSVATIKAILQIIANEANANKITSILQIIANEASTSVPQQDLSLAQLVSACDLEELHKRSRIPILRLQLIGTGFPPTNEELIYLGRSLKKPDGTSYQSRKLFEIRARDFPNYQDTFENGNGEPLTNGN